MMYVKRILEPTAVTNSHLIVKICRIRSVHHGKIEDDTNIYEMNDLHFGKAF
jgi:hypothetical protein